MIVVKAEAESKVSSPINLPTQNDKKSSSSAQSFGELLRGVKTKVDAKEAPREDVKIQGKIVQNGAVVLAFDEPEITLPNTPSTSNETKETKSEGLLSLLKGDAAILGEELQALELNPKITENLNIKEIKNLIGNAKQYLKEQILNSDGYKQSQMKELPQTLKGLAQLAKKFDINISKITVENVQVKPVTTEIDLEAEPTVVKKTTSKVELDAEIDDAPEIKTELKTDRKATKSVKASTLNQDAEIQTQKDVKQEVKQDVRADTIKVNTASKIAKTPIFKAQATSEVTTTEQVVMAKQFKVPDVKTPKDKADETLKLLLRGEKPSHTNANLTADFSVATAKVIAPRATTEASRSLESLLRGDGSSQSPEVKAELSATAHKSDSFEVKLNEAKQMIKYISSDVKQAIEDYKSPFTRIKVQLNPQKLGDVELTVVQRGKNLHVNISSNNIAVNALATNLNELKSQLTNNGINNATFNFNSSSQNDGSNNGQRSQQEHKDANDEYNYFDQEGQNEEVLSSLEIVVPSYA